MNIFWGMKNLWIFFRGGGGGHQRIGLYLGVICLHFRVFSHGQCTEWGIFLVFFFKISNILGCLKFLIFLGVNGRCWARAYVCRKNENTPSPPPKARSRRGPILSRRLIMK